MRILFTLGLVALLVACNQEPKALEKIDITPAKLAYDAHPEDSSLARAYSVQLEKAAKQDLNDSISPYHLLKSAFILRSIPGESLEAINQFKEVVKRFPEHPVGAEASFQIAFTWDEFVGNKSEAMKSYEDFIAANPTHPLRQTAEEMVFLLNLADNPKDLIESLKMINTESKE
jgi:hypothetical protein